MTRPSLNLALDLNTASKTGQGQFDNKGQFEQDYDFTDNKKNIHVFELIQQQFFIKFILFWPFKNINSLRNYPALGHLELI